MTEGEGSGNVVGKLNSFLCDLKGKLDPMSLQNKILIFLIILGIVDMVVPVPILGLTLIYVVAQKPPWFADMVSRIYESS